MTIARRLPPRGSTLVEIMVTMGVTTIVGMMVFLVLNTGMVLYAKNTAVNSAHQQARAGVDQMLANIHSAVSIPQLVDTNLQPIAAPGTGPAAGICYQTFNGGPFPVVVNAAATDTSVTLFCPGGYVAPANVRVEIPSHSIELDAISTTGFGGSVWRFNFATSIGTDPWQPPPPVLFHPERSITISGTGIEGAGTTYVITAFLTTRSSYAVIGSELRYYPTNGRDALGNSNPSDKTLYRVITGNIISPNPPNPPLPFSIPVLALGGLQNRFVAAVNLSTAEPNFNQRGYAAVNMFVSSLIPFRCRMTTLQ